MSCWHPRPTTPHANDANDTSASGQPGRRTKRYLLTRLPAYPLTCLPAYLPAACRAGDFPCHAACSQDAPQPQRRYLRKRSVLVAMSATGASSEADTNALTKMGWYTRPPPSFERVAARKTNGKYQPGAGSRLPSVSSGRGEGGRGSGRSPKRPWCGYRKGSAHPTRPSTSNRGELALPWPDTYESYVRWDRHWADPVLWRVSSASARRQPVLDAHKPGCRLLLRMDPAKEALPTRA